MLGFFGQDNPAPMAVDRQEHLLYRWQSFMRRGRGQAPEGVLADGDPEVGARIVQHAGGACSGASLEEGRQHVQEHHWVEHLQGCIGLMG